MDKKDSVYCLDCVSKDVIPGVEWRHGFPVCRVYKIPLRTDLTGQVVKSRECIADNGGEYV
jgi:hypothetical protein